MQIDHIVIAVRDFEAAAARLKAKFGLTATSGGTHPMGTANWVVPLEPPQYMELLGVGDEDVMMANEFGRRVVAVLESGDELMAWAIGVDDIDAVGQRLQRPVFPGQWEAPDGSVGRWRNVFADMKYFGDLPFFIHYDSRVREPAPVPGAITSIEVGGNRDRMLEWIGSEELPISFKGGEPGLSAVTIELPDGEIVIRNEDLRGD